MALTRRWGANVRAVVGAGGLLGALSLAVMAAIGWASGLGFGWVNTLGTANVVRSEQSNFLQQDRGLQHVRHRPAHRDDVVRDGVRTEQCTPRAAAARNGPLAGCEPPIGRRR